MLTEVRFGPLKAKKPIAVIPSGITAETQLEDAVTTFDETVKVPPPVQAIDPSATACVGLIPVKFTASRLNVSVSTLDFLIGGH
jgi:hypothetical protein